MTNWNAGRVLLALSNHFDWRQSKMMTEWFIDGGIADVLFISRHGYATEIEIKVSVSDWKADQFKGKFDQERPHVARFFYAIPETLTGKIPLFVPAETGILIVRAGTWRDTVTEHRPAVRRKALKIPEAELRRIHESMYYRFWTHETRRLQRETFDKAKIRAANRRSNQEVLCPS